jgi:hypothetical protein
MTATRRPIIRQELDRPDHGIICKCYNERYPAINGHYILMNALYSTYGHSRQWSGAVLWAS